MQFTKKTSSGKFTSIAKLLIKVILVIVILFGTVSRALFDLGLVSFDFITLIGI